MDSLYRFDDLILALEERIKDQKLNFRQVCLSTQIHPSYFSRVMKGVGSFSQAQVFSLCQVLSFNDEQTDFIFLLWQKHEATTHKEKEFFAQKIRSLREEKLKISKETFGKTESIQPSSQSIETYYSEAVTSAVHMYLTVRKYRLNPELIRENLFVTERKLNAELVKLESLGMIRRNKSTITEVKDFVLLEESSPMTVTNHINWRLKSIQDLDGRDKKAGDYRLSVAFSADEETKLKLKQLLRDTVVKAQKLVSQCDEPDDVHYFLMDLF